jgi:hypothetical protein
VPNAPLAQQSFWTHPMELQGDMGQVECHFFSFGDSVSVVQHRCIVCAKRSIGSAIILIAPNGTQG